MAAHSAESGALSTLEAGVERCSLFEPGTDFAPLLRLFRALSKGQIEAMGNRYIWPITTAGRPPG